MIQTYLDELRERLGRDPRNSARLAEIADHLQERRAALIGQGLSSAAAELLAVREFGPATTIARDFERLVGGVASQGTRLAGAVGLVGVGAVGLWAASVWFLITHPGIHPVVIPAQVLTSAVGEILVAPFLVGVVQRLAPGRLRMRMHQMISVPAVLMAVWVAVYTARSWWGTAGWYPRIPLAVSMLWTILLIVQFVGVGLLVRPFDAVAGFGSGPARVTVAVAFGLTVVLALTDLLVPTEFWMRHAMVRLVAHWLPTVVRSVGITVMASALIRERPARLLVAVGQ